MAFDIELNLLNKYLEKLVLEPSEKLKKKSFEYLRLLKLKKGAGLVNLSDSSAVVICVNLASEHLGLGFDKAQAVKIAGVSKKSYANFYHTVEKVLGLDKPMTVAELCVKLSCSDVSNLAQQLVDRYVQDEKHVVDLSHPMYACAAVLAACRHRRIRVKRELLVEACRIKPKDLDKLAADFSALANQSDKKESRKRSHHLIDMVEQMVKDSENNSVDDEKDDEEKDSKPKESYEEWKRRMLAET